MKKYVLFILMLVGCNNIKTVYHKSTLDINNKSIQQILEKAEAKEPSKSIVYFTSGFEGADIVELLNDDKILFKHPLKTINEIGLANVETVSNEKEIKINILSNKPVSFVLNRKKTRNYKFIYISKEIFKADKYIIEYSNLKKDFL